MKKTTGNNFAKLCLFFSLSFVFLFIGSALYQFLALWIDAVRMIPAPTGAASRNFISAMTRAVPGALYFSVLLSLSYSARREMSMPFSIFWTFILASLFTFGFSLGVQRIEMISPSLPEIKTLRGEEGLILSQLNTDIILLKKPEELQGPRIVSLPGKPLLYQESPRGPGNSIISLPALPFRYDYAWFFQSLLLDFNLSAGNLYSRLRQGLFPFWLYCGALVLLLSSLRFIFGLGQWPLANLFLGFLAFRGILALETFVNTREILNFLSRFFNYRIQVSFIAPGILCALGILILLYTALVYAGWRHTGVRGS